MVFLTTAKPLFFKIGCAYLKIKSVGVSQLCVVIVVEFVVGIVWGHPSIGNTLNVGKDWNTFKME